jgi:hypothetical protein
MMRGVKGFTAGLLASAMLVACGGGPASGSGANVVDEQSATADGTEETAPADTEVADEPDEPDPARDETDQGDDTEVAEEAVGEEAALGTRDEPLPPGTRIEMGDWTLAVTEVVPDAEERIAEADEFYEPPVDGRQFVMFAVDATYEGDDSGTAWLDLSWAVVGSAGNTFGTGMDDYCGLIPDPLDDTGETFPGGEVSGNVCVAVESEQVSGGTIRVEDTMSFDDTRAFYAID